MLRETAVCAGMMKRYITVMLKLTRLRNDVNISNRKRTGFLIFLCVLYILSFKFLYEIQFTKNNVSRQIPFHFHNIYDTIS